MRNRRLPIGFLHQQRKVQTYASVSVSVLCVCVCVTDAVCSLSHLFVRSVSNRCLRCNHQHDMQEYVLSFQPSSPRSLGFAADCTSECLTCTGNSTFTQCTLCANGFYVSSGSCSGALSVWCSFVALTCVVTACDGSCTTCNGAGPTHCTKCSGSLYLYNSQASTQTRILLPHTI